MSYQNLRVSEKDYKQNVIICGENGEQYSATLNCLVDVRNPKMGSILFQRTLTIKGENYRLFKYSEKQDILFYRLAK